MAKRGFYFILSTKRFCAFFAYFVNKTKAFQTNSHIKIVYREKTKTIRQTETGGQFVKIARSICLYAHSRSRKDREGESDECRKRSFIVFDKNKLEIVHSKVGTNRVLIIFGNRCTFLHITHSRPHCA